MIVRTPIPAEAYLAAERASVSTKCEWIDGEVREVTGASREHNLIVINLVKRLAAQLGKQHEMYANDMRVRVPDGPYYYPDIAVAPKPPALEDDVRDTLVNPLVIVEVLSPSTESVDRGEKLDNYRRIPSLTEYLLVSQDAPRIDRYSLAEEGGWQLEIVTAGEVELPAIACRLTLEETYAGVES